MGYLHVYITAHIYTVVACKFFSKMQPLVCKHLQKNNKGMTVHYIYIFLFINYTFKNSALFKISEKD